MAAVDLAALREVIPTIQDCHMYQALHCSDHHPVRIDKQLAVLSQPSEPNVTRLTIPRYGQFS